MYSVAACVIPFVFRTGDALFSARREMSANGDEYEFTANRGIRDFDVNLLSGDYRSGISILRCECVFVKTQEVVV